MADKNKYPDPSEKLQGLNKQLEEIANSYVEDPEKLAEYLAFATKFYKYSPNNAMLISAQNPGAVFVASFQAWKSQGYMVRKGQKAMKIFVPIITTTFTDKEGNRKSLKYASAQEKKLIKQGKIKTEQSLRFTIGNVFDIAQTNVPFEDYPKILTPGIASVKHADLSKRLKDYMAQNVCDVIDEMPDGAALRGSFSPVENLVRISPLVKDTAYLSTLTHELGHALMHKETALSSIEKEFQADAFSIMMHKELGLEVTDGRKSHLAEVFKVMKLKIRMDSLKDKPETQSQEEYLENTYRELLVSSLKEVHKTYNKNIAPIMDHLQGKERNAYIEEETPSQVLTPTFVILPR